MAWGILEPRSHEPVPGTVTLEVLNGRKTPKGLAKNHYRTANGIILSPQPSDDPDDPLNWPLWQRDLITFLLCLLAVMASTLTSILTANTLTLIVYFGGLTVTEAALLTGYHLLGTGVVGFIFVANARIWGKRHLFILGALLIIGSTIWAACAGHNYNSLVAARFIQGVGLAPFEGLVNAAVGDLYFVHESGKRQALSNLCLFGGAFFTPVIVGKVTQSLNWQWSFGFVAIFMSAIFPFVYLFCAETTYVRKTDAMVSNQNSASEPERDLYAASNNSSSLAGDSHSARDVGYKDTGIVNEKSDVEMVHIEDVVTNASHVSNDGTTFRIHRPVNRKLITRKSLALFSGRKTDDSFIKLCLRPFPLFLHPGVLWACITQCAMIAWTAVLGVTLAIILLGLAFNEAETGYMYSGAFVGAMLAFVLAGLISDPAARWLTKLNGGIFEPEFRLVLVIPLALIGISGLFGYGKVASDPGTYGWLPLDVFFGFVVAGMTLGAIVSAQYIVDAHHDISTEAFTCLLIFKNLISFGIVEKGFDWYLSAGPQGMFFIFGYVQIAICLSAVPLYVLGKRNRAFSAKHDILRLCGLR